MFAGIRSGDVVSGIAMLVVIAIPVGLCYGAPEAAVSLAMPPGELVLQDKSLWLAVPECDGAEVTLEWGGITASGSLVETAYLRDQKIARFRFSELPDSEDEASVHLRFIEPRGERCVNAGPLTDVLMRSVTGYGAPQIADTSSGPGTVARCHNLAQCAAIYPDALLIAGHSLIESAYIDSLGLLWAERMGINVAIVDAADVSTVSPVMIRDFIKSLYDFKCAEHYGDGHLGFVILVGDAYENDNITHMVPEYDGYGGNYSASDHYYACLSGNDDFEDVMLGRIPVGSPAELTVYYNKVRSYSPLPAEQWAKSVLLIAGCFFASKDDYIDLFDQFDSYVPDDFSVSRFYRYDYPLTSAGDATACQAIVDSLEKGFVFALHSGDGDKWDWGAVNERVIRSSYIPGVDNNSRLPVLISIACSNGWFDNISETYGDGSVDCFAERVLVAPSGGAIACVASGRETGGGASTIFAHEIVKAAFVNGSSFIGEMMLEAKTEHLLNLGSVSYVRQFNLFGDPCVNFMLTQLPVSSPDVVVRPYHVKVTPEFASSDEPVSITAEVWNASGVYVASLDVGIYEGAPDSGGTLLESQPVTQLYPWEKRTVEFNISNVSSGTITLCVEADCFDSVAECDETNNTFTTSTYVYPSQSGFPIRVGDDIRSQLVADLNNDGVSDILVASGGATAEAVDLAGNTLWKRTDLGLTQWFDGVEPAAADLNGDGTCECVLPIKSGIIAADGATGVNRWKVYTDYPCLSPIISDLDGDGTFEVLLGTYSFLYSKIWAYSATGNRLWIHDIPGNGEKLMGMVVCDPELDGFKDVIVGTTLGRLRRLACDVSPPRIAWDVMLSSNAISSIVAGDLERDGSIEIVANHDTTISIVDAITGGVKEAFRVTPTQCNWCLSLADVDKDGMLEILCGSSCGEIAIIDDGVMTLHVTYEGTPFRAPVAADVDGDGANEIVFALSDGQVRIINLDGSDDIEPIPLRSLSAITPIADNIDQDPDVEIVAGSIDSVLFVFDLGSGVQGGLAEWPCAAGSAFRTGLYAQPLFGALANDLTLTGRVDVVGDVQVNAGTTLTLERHADVRFRNDAVYPGGSASGRCEIMVDGQIISRGTSCGKVRAYPADYPPAKDDWQGIILKPGSSGSFTQTEITGAITAIECQTSDVCISECKLTQSSIGVKVTSASPLIDSNEITYCDYGVSAGLGTPAIVNNTITASRYGGISLSGGSTALVEANIVTGTTQGNGLAVYSSSPTIARGNRFEDNSASGMYLTNSSPAIDSCSIFTNGDCGLKLAYDSHPVISRTSIVGNKYGVGVYISAKPVLGDTAAGLGGLNDIRDNRSYAIYNKTAYQVKAQGNWWGTDQPGPSLFYGSTDYSGWLLEPPAGLGDGPRVPAFIEALCPNPFSASVELRLALLAEDLPVVVSIYDVRGCLVRKMPSPKQPGRVSIEWDGLDSFGNQAASGMYFLSVASARKVHARKLILVR